jgi:hypothetical protein
MEDLRQRGVHTRALARGHDQDGGPAHERNRRRAARSTTLICAGGGGILRGGAVPRPTSAPVLTPPARETKGAWSSRDAESSLPLSAGRRERESCRRPP